MAFSLPFVLTAASVGLSTALIIKYFGSKKDEEEYEVIGSEENISQYVDIDRVVIFDAGDKDVILSKMAEKKLLNLLKAREKRNK